MVSEEERWVLIHTKIDPKFLADVWGGSETEYWHYLDDYYRALNEEEDAYDAIAVQNEVREWVATIPDKNNIRIEAIKGQLMDAKLHPEKHDVAKLLNEVKILKGTSDRVTTQMIERAREYPIGNLIELKRNVALCPFHNEKSPSFSVKNNKYKCFGCDASGDSISLAMHLKNMTFKQAVEYLQ
jgi:hypothetical protein